jgi:hypothetical protein
MQLLIRKKFGCQTFVEGKIAKQWGGGGASTGWHTIRHNSPTRWSTGGPGLITNLFELTHSMWKQCNSVLHAVDEQGLPGQCALELEISIHSKFQQGTDGLA